MGLQSFIAERKKDKDLLVMAHVVCGYPSFEDNLKEPLVYNNDQGGTCIFMDTGSGKGGHLSGLILKGKELEIDAFLSFES